MFKTANIYLKLIIINSVILLVHCKNCHDYLRELGDAESLFVHCVTVNSVPVTMCENCNRFHENVLQKYDFLSNNCSDIYFDKDRINLIATTESVLMGLWSKAYCYDCSNNNNSGVFKDKNEVLFDCLSDNKEEPCDKCKLQYLDLNNFYTNLDQHNNGEVCYDLQDSMNRTRNKWSKELNCCRREKNFTLFLIVLSITSCLPLLFYGTTYFITKRQELYQRVLSDEDPYYSDAPTSSRQIITNALNNAAQSRLDNTPSTSNTGTNILVDNNSSNNKHGVSSNNNMDSSDDELQINLNIPSKDKIKNI